MRLATLGDVDTLIELMAEFYGESGYPLNRRHAAEAFRSLLSDDQLGHVWLIQAGAATVGYVVLTLGYSMEYGGRDAFVDDLFIQAPYRNAGLGSAALAQVRTFAESLGVRALHLEVGRDNEPAQVVYRRIGFVDNERQLLTLRLATPTHVA